MESKAQPMVRGMDAKSQPGAAARRSFWFRACWGQKQVVQASEEAAEGRGGEEEAPAAAKAPATLLEAAKEGNLQAVHNMLAKKADVNIQDGEEDRACADATPLILAARAGHENVVRRLLKERDVDVNASTRNLDNGARSKQTALHWAAREGKTTAAMAIIQDSRLDLNARTQLGFTALWIAAQSGQTQILSALLQKKADARIECFLGNGTRMTPMISALIDMQPESLRMLIADGGCDIDEVVQLVTVRHTPLGASANSNWLGHVRVLLELKADVDKEVDGATAFDLAYRGNAVEIVMNLLAHGCDTTRILTRVRHAQIVGDALTLASLVKQKKVAADDIMPDLHVAALSNNLKAFKAALAKMPDAHSARYTLDGGKMNTLFYAIELCHFEIARALMMDVHGLSEDLVQVVLAAVSEKGYHYEKGERMFRAVMALFGTTASEERKYAKGAAALLQPWMGSVPALEYFKERHAQFHQLRAVCHTRNEAIYDRIDAEATLPVLRKMAKIGQEYVDRPARQDDPTLLPKFHYFWDEKKGHTAAGDHEEFYAMDLALIASALDDAFWDAMTDLFEPISKKVHKAPSKTHTRMHNKLINPNDHADPTIPKPRPAKNVDVLRCGVEATTLEGMQQIFDALESKYKILRVKNSHDPHESGFGGYRSVLVNFVFPVDLTYGEVFGIGRFEPDLGLEEGWLREDAMANKWFDYVVALPQKLDWMWSLSGLWHIARTQPERKIVLSAEVQIIYEPYMIGRTLSHLLFKISRCETGPDEMVRDFALGFADIKPPNMRKDVAEMVKAKAVN